MDEGEEDWTALLDLYLPPVRQDGDVEGDEPPDDAPWRAALRSAAQQARVNPNGAVSSNGAAPRRRLLEGQPGAPSRDAALQDTRPRPAGPAPRLGDRVAVASLAGLRGTVLLVRGEHALVETEAARLRVRCGDLVVLSGHDGMARRPTRPTLIRQSGGECADRDVIVRGGRRGRQRWHGIDLHVLTPSEALARLDDFLFTSWEEGRESVAVVHGKGTGILRKAVRALLAAHPAVHHLLGVPAHSGGDGVTLVQLRHKSDLFDDLTNAGPGP